MEKKEKGTRVVICVLVLAGLLLFSVFAPAGNLEPNAPPGPSMKTLQEIYDACSGGINEREGRTYYIQTSPNSSEDVLTVPGGKRFVLLKLHQWTHSVDTPLPYWRLEVNNKLLLQGNINYDGKIGSDIINKATHDFPDRCVVVDAGETLTFLNQHLSYTMNTTIIGYFYSVP